MTVTPEMMDAFRAITGDVSPIHIDADYAKGPRLPRPRRLRDAGGELFSTLAGVYLPGEHCLLHGVECKFAAHFHRRHADHQGYRRERQ